MTFEEVLDQAIALLQRRGRVTYRTLQRQFQLDDEALNDLKDELLYAHPEVRDDAGRGLIWTSSSGTAPSAATAPAGALEPAPPAYIPPYLAEKILTSRSALEGERKQVTVLFADLKGSMELLADRDPEEARQLLDPVLERMMAAVHRYEGTVNQVMGDGIMALFGAPIAHEDHALRASYAALAMQAAIRIYAEAARRAHGITVQMRVGLNSGEVVVRAISNDLHMDYSAVGQTTHLAARMEQLATPGCILLTAHTLRLVEGLVQVQALGPIPVKGLPEPVEVFELVGVSTLQGRFQARVSGGLTRFVGRETERATLVQALERAGAGHGQVVVVVGEAGVGKSRLVYEFVHAPHLQGWRVLESASVSYGKATPYFPVIDLLRRYIRVEERDDVRTIRAKVTGQVLTLDAGLQEEIPALLVLLDALPEDSPFHTLDPPQRRRRMLDGLKRVLLRESQVQPLVLIFEDLHWIDSETQALLDSLVESLPTTHVLLLINYRPEYQHGWGSKTYYTQMRLDSLPPGSAEALLQVLLGEDPSLAPLQRLLITRTEGNPFFLEESVRTLVETGVLVGTPGAYRLAQALPTSQVPATVQAVLAARIDRLPPVTKRLLQTAAVIGTEVPLPLLQAIAELPEAALHGSLAHLQAAEFLYETRLFPEREYTFKHALTHEVAYSSVLQERRRVLHARIVETLEVLVGDRVAEQVERLAHHALRGEVWDKALVFSRQAGEKAMARVAYREAVACFEQALGTLQHLPERRNTQEQAIDLRLDLRHALIGRGEFGQGFEYLREAGPLAEALGDQRRLGHICGSMTQALWTRGDYDNALTWGQRPLALALASGDVLQHAAVHGILGTVYFCLGDYRRATDMLRQAITSLPGESLQARFGTGVLTSVRDRLWLMNCCEELGEFAEGVAYGEEAARIAETVGHTSSAIMAQYRLGQLALRQGAPQLAISRLTHALAQCRATDALIWVPAASANLGLAYALSGRIIEALALLDQIEVRETPAMGGSSVMLKMGEAYLLASRVADAHRLAERALALAGDRKERGHQAWALRLWGKMAAHHDPPEFASATAYYRQALTLAEELGMRPLQAHCHRGLGTLYATVGQREQACMALTTAIEMYRAMDLTFWLPQAETALAQVA